MANVDDDFVSNESDNESFADVIEARLSRRSVVGGGLADRGGRVARAASARCSGRARAGATHRNRPLLGFKGIPVSSADTVVVPEGYTAEVLIAWGDPVSDGPAFKPDASNSAAEQARQWGMHNDGVVYFPIRGSAARPARAEQRVHRRRAALPRRHRQLERGEDAASRWPRTASPSSRSAQARRGDARS